MPLIGGIDRIATGAAHPLMTTPTSKGASTKKRSDRAIAQAPTVSPSTISGTATGRSATVPTESREEGRRVAEVPAGLPHHDRDEGRARRHARKSRPMA